MAWVVTPPTQTQESKTGWVTSPTTTPITPQRGWVGTGQVTIMWGPRGAGALVATTMARPSKAAPLIGDGALSATVFKREYRVAALSGGGTLAVSYSQIHPAAPLFNSMGFLFGDTVSTHQEAFFGGEGMLSATSDGLRATVVPGLSVDCFFSGEGNLVPSFETIYVIFKEFAGEGTLTGPLVPKLVANLAGSGQLSATAFEVYVRTVALLASGTLSATHLHQYLRSISFAGAGALTNLLQILYTPAAGGTGTVSATTKQIYANAPALSGSGTLSAAAFGGMLPNLAGSGALSATRFPAYPRAAGVSGVGALAGAGFSRYMRGFGDDFNRADSTTSAGPGWTNRYNVIGVSGNAAYAENSQTNWCIATPDIVMAGDDAEATIVVGPPNASENMFVGLGLNTVGQGAFYYCNGSSHYIFNQDAWPVQWAPQASAPGATITTGDRMTIRRVGNIYTGLLNGVPQVSWTDSGNIIPRDVNHRLYEIGLYPGTRIVDAFYANDIDVLSGSGTMTGATVQKYSLPPAANRVVDGGFETDAAWQYFTDGAMSTEQAHSGSRSRKFISIANYLQMTLTNEPSGLGYGVFHPTSAGRYVYMEAWLRRGPSNTDTGVIFLRLQSRDGAGADIDFPVAYIPQNSFPKDVWTKFSVELTMPANAADYYTAFLIDIAVPAGDVFYLDDVLVIDVGGVGSTGSGTISASVMKKEFRNANLSGGGSLSATAVGFVPFSETNTARTNQTVPAGCGGCWVTLIGGGGGGGCGGTNQGSGGAGGGGGGKVGRSFIPRASLGATYSVVVGTGGAKGLASNNSDGSAGTASTFSSGGVSWSAGGGGAGAKGGTGSSSTAGAGGTCSTTGVAGTINNGTAGGAGTGGAGTAAANNANGAAAGGGAGGKGTVFGSNAGGKGGNSSTITGGNGGNPGATPSNASAGNGGGGGGGGNENGTGGAAGDAGNGGGYGGGGGGGGGTNNLASGAQGDGGTGAGAYTLVEWVGT